MHDAPVEMKWNAKDLFSSNRDEWMNRMNFDERWWNRTEWVDEYVRMVGYIRYEWMTMEIVHTFQFSHRWIVWLKINWNSFRRIIKKFPISNSSVIVLRPLFFASRKKFQFQFHSFVWHIRCDGRETFWTAKSSGKLFNNMKMKSMWKLKAERWKRKWEKRKINFLDFVYFHLELELHFDLDFIIIFKSV